MVVSLGVLVETRIFSAVLLTHYRSAQHCCLHSVFRDHSNTAPTSALPSQPISAPRLSLCVDIRQRLLSPVLFFAGTETARARLAVTMLRVYIRALSSIF